MSEKNPTFFIFIQSFFFIRWFSLFTFDREFGTCGCCACLKGHRATVFEGQLLQQEQVPAAALKCHNLSTGRFLHWFPVQEPAAVYALGTRQGALEQRFASVKGLCVLQTLDNGDGFG